jgi:hypothetical protein
MEAGQKRPRDEQLSFSGSSLAPVATPEVSPWEQRFANLLDLRAGGCLQQPSDPASVIAVLTSAQVNRFAGGFGGL